MPTWTNQTKNTATHSQPSKNTATWDFEIVAGGPWAYNLADLDYNAIVDKTGDTVYYNAIGIGQTYTYLIKH